MQKSARVGSRISREILAGVFLVAGLAKLRDLPGSRQAVRDFGVPAVLAGPLGLLLPLAELGVALALLPRASAWFGALGAGMLLVAFIVGIGVNLATGKTPDCHCFGQLHSEPVGWRTLTRNAVLVVLAALVLSQGPSHPGPSAVAWVGHLTGGEAIALAAGLVGFALLAVQGWVVLHLLRQNGRLLLRLDALEAAAPLGHQHAPTPAPAAPAQGLPVAAAAPGFELPDLDGEPVSLDALRSAGKPVVLLFTDPGCGPCTALLPEVARWRQTQADQLTLAVVSRGPIEENRAKAKEHDLGTVLVQTDREVSTRYQAQATPSAVLVRPDGSIGTPVAAGADAIHALLTSAPDAPLPLVRHPPGPAAAGNGNNWPQPALTPGDLAPPVRLADLDGAPVTLVDFRRNTVVLFWNPGCGFCQRMLPDPKAWEQERPPETPELLVVSTGSAQDNRAQGIRSPFSPRPGLCHREGIRRHRHADGDPGQRRRQDRLPASRGCTPRPGVAAGRGASGRISGPNTAPLREQEKFTGRCCRVMDRASSIGVGARVRPLDPPGDSAVDPKRAPNLARPIVEQQCCSAERSNRRRRSGHALAQALGPRPQANPASGARHAKGQSSIAAPDC